MLDRPSFDDIYMRLARSLSARSTCSRLQVGAVLTTLDHRKVVAIGYNGNAAGLPNQCDSDTPGACGDLHAEINAVINCDAPRSTTKILYVTHAPCKMCAKAVVNLGNVVRVVYGEDYRSDEGLAILRECGIEVVPWKGLY